jgi:hypothetical protein
METLPYEIGTLVLFKGRGLGVGRITKFYEKENLYGIEILDKLSWVRSAPEHFSPIEKGEADLVRALDGVGLF